MNGLDKRRLVLAGSGLALFGGLYMAPPIADIRITSDIADNTISRLETKIDLGVIAISYLHEWKRSLP